MTILEGKVEEAMDLIVEQGRELNALKEWKEQQEQQQEARLVFNLRQWSCNAGSISCQFSSSIRHSSNSVIAPCSMQQLTVS